LISTQLILPQAILGIVISLIAARRMMLLYLYLGLQTVGISLFFVTARYRLTVLPVLCLFAASAAVWIVVQARHGRILRVALSAGAIALLSWSVSPQRLALNMAELKRWDSVNTGLAYGSEVSGYARALKLLGEVASSYPLDPDSHIFYGIALRNSGRVTESLDEFECARTLASDNPIVLFQIGKSRRELGQDSLAIAAFTTAISIAPLYEDAHKHLAFTYVDMGRYAEAQREFGTALKIEPTNSSLHLNLGVTCGKMGMRREAISHFEQALEYDKANWKAMYNLAVAVCEEGDRSEARRLLRTILRHDPSNTVAKKALAEIRT